MCMYKAGILLSVELVVIAIGFYFFYLAKREDSKHLKIGAYILTIGGILLVLTTAGMTIKKMACKKQCDRKYHGYHRGGGDWEGKRQCLDKEKGERGEGREEREEKDD